jgi:hypothetical protein
MSHRCGTTGCRIPAAARVLVRGRLGAEQLCYLHLAAVTRRQRVQILADYTRTPPTEGAPR